MAGIKYADTVKGNFLMHWNGVAAARKPVIAAVNGYAVIIIYKIIIIIHTHTISECSILKKYSNLKLST